MKEIYVVERCMFVNGCDYHYDNVYYASTFERAKEYIKAWEDRSDLFDLEKINDNYWKLPIDFEDSYGIMKVELDGKFFLED